MKYDIAIIGGGIIGCAIARELSRYDLRIAVIEQGNDVSLGSTKANSGIIHGGYDAQHGSMKAKFSRAGNRMYEQWNEELHFGIRWTGSLVCAFNDEELLILQKTQENGKKNGVLDLEIITQKQIRALEPNIHPNITHALYCPSAGIVSPYEVCIALAENSASNGVDFLLSHQVVSIKAHTCPSEFTIACNTQEIQARCVINSAGVFADDIAAMINPQSQFSITPRKGHYYVFNRGYMPVQHVIFTVPTKLGKGILVSPTYHGNLIIGPDSQEVSDKHDTIPNPEKLDVLFNTAKHTLPDLDVTKKIRSYAGLRATSNKKDFMIEPDATHPHFINVAGIESPGLTSAPAISQYVISLIQEHTDISLMERSDFIAHRELLIPCQIHREFLPMQEVTHKAKLPEDNPQRIICRCEQVIQQTILNALERSPHPLSIDAVKRRTRASMGICQGKFCRPRIKSLLAQKYNISEDEIPEK